ncbi:MAG: outer membrane beta-barrel protein [Opitutae bacterium]|nr:outer membrane beta-barrel protein [Opitutae bacterium]
MKTLKWLLPALALSSASIYAAPFMAVGDNAELFLTGSIAVRFDDNIFLSPDSSATAPKVSDTIVSFKPGVELVFGKGSANKGNLHYREEYVRYSDNDNQNSSIADLGFTSQYDNGKTKMGAAASFVQLAQNQPGVGAGTGRLARRDVTNGKANTEFAFSEKTSFGAALVFDKTNYADAAFTDSSAWSVPVDVYYEMTPKLDMSVGYRYRATTLSGSASDNKEHFLNIGSRGEFTPKLNGQVRVGYNKRTFDRGSDESGFGLDTSLGYAYSEKTSFQLSVNNGFGNSATGQSTKVFSAGVSGRSALSEQWSMGASLDLRSVDYRRFGAIAPRSEDYYQFGLNVSYVYSSYLNFTAAYDYKNNDASIPAGSNVDALSFSNSVFSFGANVRY